MIYYLTSGVFCYAKRNTKQKLRQKHALKILLSIAQLPRATFYYHLKRMNSADKYKAVKAEITAIYHENKGRYGYRRITTELHKRNFLLNHKTVQRLMKELGLVCRVRMKKYRSYRSEVGKTAPNLLNRDFHADKPNQKWVTDQTGTDRISGLLQQPQDQGKAKGLAACNSQTASPFGCLNDFYFKILSNFWGSLQA